VDVAGVGVLPAVWHLLKFNVVGRVALVFGERVNVWLMEQKVLQLSATLEEDAKFVSLTRSADEVLCIV